MHYNNPNLSDEVRAFLNTKELAQLKLIESIEVLKDLMCFGTHEGECTNSGKDAYGKPCHLHSAALQARYDRAAAFLRQNGEEVPLGDLKFDNL